MNNAEELARAVLDMRAKQVDYYKLEHRKRFNPRMDGEELAKAYSEMREAEARVQDMCLDILGIGGEIVYGST